MDIKTLQIILNTLNKITVAGKENIAMVLGCINILEKTIREAEEEAQDDTDHQAE